MSARSTYGIAVTIATAAITAVTNITPPSLEAVDPVDDARHADTDGIQRWVPSGRKAFTDCVITANDVASCPGIAAAVTAVGGAAVAVVITYPSSGGTVTFNGLVQSVVAGENPLSGKREVTITIKPSPVRA
jgi:hypothetical protein